MTTTPDSPIRNMIVEFLAQIDAEGRQQIGDFDVERDCPGVAWWRKQPTDKLTLGELVTMLADGLKAGSIDAGWVFIFITHPKIDLYPEGRAQLLELLPDHQAITAALVMDELTNREKDYLKICCATRYADIPGMQKKMFEKMGLMDAVEVSNG